MSESWKTKYGPRRVRRDPPTLAEAIAAAQGLSDDRDQQVEMAAGLMGASSIEVRAEMKKIGADRAVPMTTVVSGRDRHGPRTVVVERKSSRRFAAPAGRSEPVRPITAAQRAR